MSGSFSLYNVASLKINGEVSKSTGTDVGIIEIVVLDHKGEKTVIALYGWGPSILATARSLSIKTTDISEVAV